MNIHFYKDIYKDIFKSSEGLDAETYKDLLAKQLILRDYLAIERTILTNEATFLAYIRTSLTVMVVGVTLFKLYEYNINPILHTAGIVLALIGFIILAIGASRTIDMKKKINKFLQKRREAEQVISSVSN